MLISSFLVSFITLLSIYVLLTTSLGLLIGQTGLFSLSHAALFGVGAYTSAIVTMNFPMPFIVGLIAAMVMSGMISAVITLPSFRVSGDHFVVAALGAQVVLQNLFANWTEVTGGYLGLRNIQRPMDELPYMMLVLATTVVVSIGLHLVISSPYGQVLNALKEDEDATRAVGKRVEAYKTSAAVLAGSIAGLAGSFYAHHILFLNPSSFTFTVSITIALMLIFGGANRVMGVVVGVIIIQSIPELLRRYVHVSETISGPLYLLVLGCIIIIMMFIRPQGLLGKRTTTSGRTANRKRLVDADAHANGGPEL